MSNLNPDQFQYVPVSYTSLNWVKGADDKPILVSPGNKSLPERTRDFAARDVPARTHNYVFAHAPSGEQAGFVSYSADRGNPEFDVEPEYQGRGVATRLAETAKSVHPHALDNYTPVTHDGLRFGETLRKRGLIK